MGNKHGLTLIEANNFTSRNTDVKLHRAHIDEVTAMLVRKINQHRLNYHQLKNIFSVVRRKCRVDVPKRGTALYEIPTKQELTLFYSAVKDPVHKLIFEVLEDTGVRVQELCHLRVQDIDFSNNTIFIKQGKGAKDRVTLMSDNLKDKLQLYLQAKNHKFLFESNRNTQYTTRRIQYLCTDYKNKTTIEKKFTCHTFRHLWNTRLALNNIPKEKRELLAGHSPNSKVQERYTHLSVDGFKDQIIKVLNHYRENK